MSSDSRVFVVELGPIRKHPNADSLSIVDVFDGYPCILRTGDFQQGDLAAYVPVDMLCPLSSPTFTFLDPKKAGAKSSMYRIKAKRLRGVFSMGLLVKVPEGTKAGDDVTEMLGCQKEPEENSHGPSRPGGKFLPGDAEADPGFLPAYTDIENLRKWKNILQSEEVCVTEKIHGCNASFVWHRDRLWIRSRRQFKKPEGGGVWADVAKKYHFDEVLRLYPDIALYGEVYGQVQDLQYGVNGTDLIVFDAYDLRTGKYLDRADFIAHVDAINVTLQALYQCRPPQIKTAPVLYHGPYDYDTLAALAEGLTVVGEGRHVREGIVVKPLKERWDEHLGRVILKLAGEGYLTR